MTHSSTMSSSEKPGMSSRVSRSTRPALAQQKSRSRAPNSLLWLARGGFAVLAKGLASSKSLHTRDVMTRHLLRSESGRFLETPTNEAIPVDGGRRLAELAPGDVRQPHVREGADELHQQVRGVDAAGGRASGVRGGVTRFAGQGKRYGRGRNASSNGFPKMRKLGDPLKSCGRLPSSPIKFSRYPPDKKRLGVRGASGPCAQTRASTWTSSCSRSRGARA